MSGLACQQNDEKGAREAKKWRLTSPHPRTAQPRVSCGRRSMKARDFATPEGECDGLYEASSPAAPLQSWSQPYCWWENRKSPWTILEYSACANCFDGVLQRTSKNPPTTPVSETALGSPVCSNKL